MYSSFLKVLHPVVMGYRSYIINIAQYMRGKGILYADGGGVSIPCPLRCGAQGSLRRTSPTARKLMTHIPISLPTYTVILDRKPLCALYPGCGEPEIMPLTRC